MSTATRTDRRSKLLSLLTEACEIEHSLACAYLYAAFSLKKDIGEGLSAPQVLKTVNNWAATIFAVAGHEMLHLAQAWNLLTAVGGTPYYGRPNFPLQARYYDFNLPVELRPFGVDTMQRFVHYEQPAELTKAPMFEKELGISSIKNRDYRTVAELYGLVGKHIEGIPEKELFLGDPARQIDREFVDFPDLVKVVDRESAHKAIDLIVKQGEGSPADRTSSHYGAFLGILNQLRAERNVNREFQPARKIISNPSANDRDDQGTRKGVTYIKDANTRFAARRFDASYSLMLRCLGFVFSNSTADRRFLKRVSTLALHMMMRVVVPFGEALTKMPAGVAGKNAGPTFGISRHIAFPQGPKRVDALVAERLCEIKEDLGGLIGKAKRPVPGNLNDVESNLGEMIDEWRAGGV